MQATNKFENEAAVAVFARLNTQQFNDQQALDVAEIGDGNINFVYRVSNAQNSVIVKQALPYIRVIGEDWPLTVDRIRIEHQALLHQAKWAPEQVPQVYHFDAQSNALAMEDIGAYHNYRQLLIDGQGPQQAGEWIGQFLARTLFHSSDFFLQSTEKRQAIEQFQNPELCKISEEVYFWDPFCDHPRNNVPAAVREQAKQLWANPAVRVAVGQLKLQFMGSHQALLHGDLHTGSLFANDSGLKVIDPEFAFYGPMGFDIGVAMANLIMAMARAYALDDEAQASHCWRVCEELWQSFEHEFVELTRAHCEEPSLKNQGVAEAFVAQVWQDSLGFAAVEIARRTIGVAHVADIEEIADEAAKARAQSYLLNCVEAMLLARAAVDGADELLLLLEQLRGH